MSRYILVRLGQGLITLFVLVSLIFVLARLIGNPVDMMLGPEASPAQRAEMIHSLGLDRPVYEQYGDFIWGLAHGDVGTSIKYRVPVVSLFAARFPNTLMLAGAAIVIATGLGFALGIGSGTRRGSFFDHSARAVSVVGMSAPSFWVGLIFILVFAVRLHVVPVARISGPLSFLMPAFTLSFVTLAGIARLVRSSMIEVLNSEYVKLARIKGVSTTAIVWVHCLRNALLPVLTFIGIHFAHLLSGSVVVESVFAWPGVGRLMYEGIIGRDYPLVQGCLLIVGIIIVLMNLLVDLLYVYVDPRVRVAGAR